MMAMLWAQQIMLGKKTYEQVPRLLKDKVKEIWKIPEWANLLQMRHRSKGENRWQ